MPIQSHVHSPPSKAEFIVGRDVDLQFCTDQCLLKKLDDRSRVVRTGQTRATALTAIVDRDHLLVPLAGARRAEAHVLGGQCGQESARVKWEKLLGHRHSALMPVYRVCNCMAEVQILDGEAFEDVATTPAWKKFAASSASQLLRRRKASHLRSINGALIWQNSLKGSMNWRRWG